MLKSFYLRSVTAKHNSISGSQCFCGYNEFVIQCFYNEFSALPPVSRHRIFRGNRFRFWHNTRSFYGFSYMAASMCLLRQLQFLYTMQHCGSFTCLRFETCRTRYTQFFIQRKNNSFLHSACLQTFFIIHIMRHDDQRFRRSCGLYYAFVF